MHLDEDLDSIGQDSPMFQRGLALKQKKVQSMCLEKNDEICFDMILN